MHVYKEQNMTTNVMAKKALRLDWGLHVFDRPLEWALLSVIDDLIGVSNIRKTIQEAD